MNAEVDKAILGNVIRALVGQCAYCGCHGDSCKKDDDTCGWADELQTRCTGYNCLRAHAVALAKDKRVKRVAVGSKKRRGSF